MLPDEVARLASCASPFCLQWHEGRATTAHVGRQCARGRLLSTDPPAWLHAANRGLRDDTQSNWL
eukprot:6850943-Lingulodinium_polyedra.AAC.1